MRTTVRLDEALLGQAKAYAARHGRTLTSVLEDALRELLNRHEASTDRPRVTLDVFHGTGLMPGIEIDRGARLHDLLDAEDAERLRRVADAPA
jgi:Bacterial antitoxin of type II TA system, VapB